MVRVRTTDGSLHVLGEKARFVEICDKQGGLAVVVFINDAGVIKILSPGDDEFLRYVKAYRPAITKVLEI